MNVSFFYCKTLFITFDNKKCYKQNKILSQNKHNTRDTIFIFALLGEEAVFLLIKCTDLVD